MTDDLTDAVVATALGLELDAVPPVSAARGSAAVLDLLACAIAGTTEPGAAGVAGWVADLGGRPDATLWGASTRAPAALAALANGTASHALDYDDVAMTMIHPSAAVVPALLAVGETVGCSGRDLLAAYVAGFEVQTRICRAINPEHYDRGWHTMQTVGVLGATLALSRLLRVDQVVAARALGIAASSAGGIRRNFGTTVKPLHAGHAAMHAVEAVQLARRGVTASEHVLTGPNGFLDVFCRPEAEAELLAAFALGAPLELAESGIAIKRFACCGAIHTALDSVEAMVAEDGLRPDRVERIECRVNPISPNILIHHGARTGLEGKFSVEYSIAVLLLTGRAGLAQYTDELAADLRLRDLMSRVDFVVDESLPVDLAFFATIVTATCTDGTVLRRRVDVQRGYPERPLRPEERFDKVHDCCDPVLGRDRADRLIRAASALATLPHVGELTTLLGPTGRSAA